MRGLTSSQVQSSIQETAQRWFRWYGTKWKDPLRKLKVLKKSASIAVTEAKCLRAKIPWLLKVTAGHQRQRVFAYNLVQNNENNRGD